MAAVAFHPVFPRSIRRFLTDSLHHKSALSCRFLVLLVLFVPGVLAASEEKARERQMTTWTWERRRAEAEECWQKLRRDFEEQIGLINARWEAERKGFEARMAEVMGWRLGPLLADALPPDTLLGPALCDADPETLKALFAQAATRTTPDF